MNNKAIVLYSGGLDSLLALHIALRLGLEVSALFINTPFYKKDIKSLQDNIEKLNIKLYVAEIDNAYLNILKNPTYGFGKNLNPCLDCRIMMFSEAKKLMENLGASFIITGEVLSQRPFSQRNKANILLIEKKSQLENLVLRPLSAKLLPPTLAEIEGIVDRSKLYAISGRSRKPQLALAKLFNIERFETPSGGCLLTEPYFANRLRNFLDLDLLEHYKLAHIGRHFKINDNLLIVARQQNEFDIIASYKNIFDFFETKDSPGTCAIFLKQSTQNEKMLASKIVLRYSKKAKSVLCFSNGNCQLFEDLELIEENKLMELRVEG
jgi:tRNA U34 2-thiouridine synthase MnmA/TrmU